MWLGFPLQSAIAKSDAMLYGIHEHAISGFTLSAVEGQPLTQIPNSIKTKYLSVINPRLTYIFQSLF